MFDPDAAIAAGHAALYLGRYTDLEWFARLAAGTRRSGDAAALRASLATARNAPQEAIGYLLAAYMLHVALGNWSTLSRDEYLLAQVRSQSGDLGGALEAATVARQLATLPGARGNLRMAVYAEIAIAEMQRIHGDLAQAEAAIERAAAVARVPSDKVVVWLKQAVIYGDEDHLALAAGPLRRALVIELWAAAPRPDIVQALWLNLAAVDRAAGDVAGALGKIEIARAAGVDDMSYHHARARTLARADRFADASRALAMAERAQVTGEWAYIIAFERARLAAQMGDIAGAIEADKRAIAVVTTLAQGASELAPALVAFFREAHLHLIGLYAGQRRFGDALEVVALLDAQALLGSRAAPLMAPPTMTASSEPAPREPSPRATAGEIARAWRGRTLVIAVPDGEQLWRLTVRDDRIDGAVIGGADVLTRHARVLERDPMNIAAGRALGEALLTGVPEDSRIDVLVVGPIARMSLAVLRFGEQFASRRWQISRALGVLPHLPSTKTRVNAAGAVVLGDPRGDLPASAAAAVQVARTLGGTLFVGAAANRPALATARGRAVLHVAAHAHVRGVTSVLQLADGDAGEAEVAALVPSPRLVVLVSCASALGHDDAGHGSLALAFVNAGAEFVVATERSVSDAEVAAFTTAFYEAGGARDPVGVLANAQVAFATVHAALAPLIGDAGPPVWSAFAVIAGRPSATEPRSARAASP